MRFFFRQHQRFVLFVLTSLVCILFLVIFQKTRPVVTIMNVTRAGVTLVGTSVATVIEHIFYSKSELFKTNERLRAELEYLALEVSEVQRLREQNAALSALLQFESRSSLIITTAAIISRSNNLSGEAVLLDRGEDDGVRVGDAVVVDDGFLVAVIDAVSRSTSIARLITDQESNVGVRILDAESTIGIAAGQNGELLMVDFIPQSVELVINDLIITSGLDPGIPQGLIIGTISEILRDEHNPFQQALIQPLVDFRRLTVVGILQVPS